MRLRLKLVSPAILNSMCTYLLLEILCCIDKSTVLIRFSPDELEIVSGCKGIWSRLAASSLFEHYVVESLADNQ
jgi:hypothetical protein